ARSRRSPRTALRRALTAVGPGRLMALSSGDFEKFAVQPRPRAGLVDAGPQAFVPALPVVDPGTAASLSVVNRPLEQVKVTGMPRLLRPLDRGAPHAARVWIALALPSWEPPAAGPVPQLFGARHRAGVAGGRQCTLTAHAAAEHPLLDHPLAC